MDVREIMMDMLSDELLNGVDAGVMDLLKRISEELGLDVTGNSVEEIREDYERVGYEAVINQAPNGEEILIFIVKYDRVQAGGKIAVELDFNVDEGEVGLGLELSTLSEEGIKRFNEAYVEWKGVN